MIFRPDNILQLPIQTRYMLNDIYIFYNDINIQSLCIDIYTPKEEPKQFRKSEFLRFFLCSTCLCQIILILTE